MHIKCMFSILIFHINRALLYGTQTFPNLPGQDSSNDPWPQSCDSLGTSDKPPQTRPRMSANHHHYHYHLHHHHHHHLLQDGATNHFGLDLKQGWMYSNELLWIIDSILEEYSVLTWSLTLSRLLWGSVHRKLASISLTSFNPWTQSSLLSPLSPSSSSPWASSAAAPSAPYSPALPGARGKYCAKSLEEKKAFWAENRRKNW